MKNIDEKIKSHCTKDNKTEAPPRCQIIALFTGDQKINKIYQKRIKETTCKTIETKALRGKGVERIKLNQCERSEEMNKNNKCREKWGSKNRNNVHMEILRSDKF